MYTFSAPLATPPLASVLPALTAVGAMWSSLPIIASDVDLRSLTFTAAFGVAVAASSSLVKNVSPVAVPVLSIAEPTLFTMELPPVVLPAASWKDTITSLAGTSLPAEPSRFVV